MANQRDIKPGVFETISDVSIGTFQLNVDGYIKLDGYHKYLMSDIVIKQGATVVSPTNYTLLTDTDATTQESGQSGKTLYGAIRITNVAFVGVELNISGSNFGTYASNESSVEYVNNELLSKTSATGSDIQEGEKAIFAGTGQDIKSDNTGSISLWDVGTIYSVAGTLVRLEGDTYVATGKATNQGLDPRDETNAEYWYMPEEEKDLKRAVRRGAIINGDMHTIHDRTSSEYATNLRVGKRQINGSNKEFHIIHLDGSTVTGNSTLENLLTDSPYIDIYAPEVLGVRTLIDIGEYIRTPQSSSGNNDVLGEVLEDRLQGFTISANYRINPGSFSTAQPVAFQTGSGSYTWDDYFFESGAIDDGVNGTPRKGLTTRPKEFTEGCSYIVVQADA